MNRGINNWQTEAGGIFVWTDQRVLCVVEPDSNGMIEVELFLFCHSTRCIHYLFFHLSRSNLKGCDRNLHHRDFCLHRTGCTSSLPSIFSARLECLVFIATKSSNMELFWFLCGIKTPRKPKNQNDQKLCTMTSGDRTTSSKVFVDTHHYSTFKLLYIALAISFFCQLDLPNFLKISHTHTILSTQRITHPGLPPNAPQAHHFRGPEL